MNTRSMMLMRPRKAMQRVNVALAAALIFLGACGDGPLAVSVVVGAVARASCGPTDGPAVRIELTGTARGAASDGPLTVHVTVWRAPSELRGNWVLTSESDQSQALLVGQAGDVLEIGGRGRIRILELEDDLTVHGDVDVAFPSGHRLQGRFAAPWVAVPIICG